MLFHKRSITKLLISSAFVGAIGTALITVLLDQTTVKNNNLGSSWQYTTIASFFIFAIGWFAMRVILFSPYLLSEESGYHGHEILLRWLIYFFTAFGIAWAIFGLLSFAGIQ